MRRQGGGRRDQHPLRPVCEVYHYSLFSFPHPPFLLGFDPGDKALRIQLYYAAGIRPSVEKGLVGASLLYSPYVLESCPSPPRGLPLNHGWRYWSHNAQSLCTLLYIFFIYLFIDIIVFTLYSRG